MVYCGRFRYKECQLFCRNGRGPIRIQHDFLKLMAISSQASSFSHTRNDFSSWLMEGDDNKMSSAYNITKQPLNKEPNLLKSSKYKANRNGDNTEPCLTPKLISNIDDMLIMTICMSWVCIKFWNINFVQNLLNLYINSRLYQLVQRNFWHVICLKVY